MIVTRKLSGFDPPFVTLLYSLPVGVIGGALFAIPQWVWPAGILEWSLVLALGALGGLGHYLLILAYRLAPASSVSPFLYFQLLSMISFGYFIFGDTPDHWSMIGSAVVIASGLYLVHRERIAGAADRATALEQQAAL
jgi:drug/metabolite transporter (DMT)-like permease